MADHDKEVEEFGQALNDFLMQWPESDEGKKTKQKVMDDLWQEMEYGVIDRMSETIEGFVRGMASKVVEEILEGRPDQMRRYLKLDGYTGRYTEKNPWGKSQDVADAHPVIHGELHEGHCLAIRRKMAEAHKDLIHDERITDLEDQVKSLVAQVRKKDAEIDALRDRLAGGRSNY